MATTKSSDYAELAEELIENQRSVFGQQALELAMDVPGLWVEESGEVAVCGDGKTAIEELAEAYTNAFGAAAGSSLRIAASEYEDTLDLPVNLEM